MLLPEEAKGLLAEAGDERRRRELREARRRRIAALTPEEFVTFLTASAACFRSAVPRRRPSVGGRYRL